MFDWLGLACEVQVLSKHLCILVETDAEDEASPGQLLLFPFDMKTRERFGELALTFDICRKNETHTKFLEITRNLRFLRYEMFEFVRHVGSEEQWEPIIEDMMSISSGIRLEDEAYLKLVSTFTGIADTALHRSRNMSSRTRF